MKYKEYLNFINHLNSQTDIIAYRHTKDLGGNDYFVAAVESKNFKGDTIYSLYNIYNYWAEKFCRDLRGFCSYNTKELAIEAIERICGGNNATIIK